MSSIEKTYTDLLELKLRLFEDRVNGEGFLIEFMKIRERFLVDFTVNDFDLLHRKCEKDFENLVENIMVTNRLIRRKKAPTKGGDFVKMRFEKG